jgi:uncharacterized protein (TIGR02271 family)
MTRSEEELRTCTERRATSRVSLRKWVETEYVTVAVPVQREKVRIEREPITGAATAGADDSDDEEPSSSCMKSSRS